MEMSFDQAQNSSERGGRKKQRKAKQKQTGEKTGKQKKLTQ